MLLSIPVSSHVLQIILGSSSYSRQMILREDMGLEFTILVYFHTFKPL